MTGNIEKIAEFLKISVTDELIKNIADNCHIDKMRQATTEIKQDIFKDFLVNGKPVMYRKGITAFFLQIIADIYLNLIFFRIGTYILITERCSIFCCCVLHDIHVYISSFNLSISLYYC